MLTRALLPAATAALLATSGVAGAATALMPGVKYDRKVRLIGGGPVVLHVVTAPAPGGLHALRPVLSQGQIPGRRTVPHMQAALSAKATSAAVNGDFFNLRTGRPSGMFLRDGVLFTRPLRGRSALGIAFDGSLVVDRFQFRGNWRGGGPLRPLKEMNRPFGNSPGVALYTPVWGAATPRSRGAVDVVLSGVPKTVVNGWHTGTVTAVRRNGATPVPRGGAVLQARGKWRSTLLAEAPLGSQVRVRGKVPNLPVDVADVIGGGPELVRNGRALVQTDEWFTLAQLKPRHPRTAVGQLADGRIILVVADGRSSRSVGLSHASLARTMVSLGAVTAMGFDGGGSSTISFEGQVLNRPSDGALRPVSNSLMVLYYGVYAPPAKGGVLSPNRDGISEKKTLTAKVVRRSSVSLRLVRPNGTTAWSYEGVVRPGWLRHTAGRPTMPDGRWTWVAEATEVASGRTSSMKRAFTVNKTLGHLRLTKKRMAVAGGRGGRLGVSLRLSRRADVVVRVKARSGAVRRVLFQGAARAGPLALRWDGRNRSGRVVGGGTYVVEATARNAVGAVTLSKKLTVVRAPKKPR